MLSKQLFSAKFVKLHCLTLAVEAQEKDWCTGKIKTESTDY